jgi:hypothetical protein
LTAGLPRRRAFISSFDVCRLLFFRCALLFHCGFSVRLRLEGSFEGSAGELLRHVRQAWVFGDVGGWVSHNSGSSLCGEGGRKLGDPTSSGGQRCWGSISWEGHKPA